MSEISEKELIDLAKCGDPESLAILYEDNVDEVYNFIKNNLEDHNEEDALDLTQEVFLRCFRKIKDFEERSNLRTWLIGIARYVIREHNRKKHPTVQLGRKGGKIKIGLVSIDVPIINENGQEIHFDIAAKNDTPEQAFAKKEEEKIIGEAIDQLPREERAVAILRLGTNKKIGSLSVKETAEYMQKSEDAVNTAFCRAIEKLQKKIPR